MRSTSDLDVGSLLKIWAFSRGIEIETEIGQWRGNPLTLGDYESNTAFVSHTE